MDDRPLSPLRDFHRPRLWLGVWLAAIAATLVLGVVPLPAIDAPVAHFDKIEHAVGYALLAASAACLFRPGRPLFGVLLALVALGIVIELLQALLPWRSAELMDALANAVGVAIGGALALTPLAGILQALDRRLA
jgi:VanZ family protein